MTAETRSLAEITAERCPRSSCPVGATGSVRVGSLLHSGGVHVAVTERGSVDVGHQSGTLPRRASGWRRSASVYRGHPPPALCRSAGSCCWAGAAPTREVRPREAWAQRAHLRHAASAGGGSRPAAASLQQQVTGNAQHQTCGQRVKPEADLQGQLRQKVRLYEHPNTARRQPCGQRVEPETELGLQAGQRRDALQLGLQAGKRRNKLQETPYVFFFKANQVKVRRVAYDPD